MNLEMEVLFSKISATKTENNRN